MPSPDDTFYNMKRLHRWFAVSALALVAATLWMLAADHWREWKKYQRMFRDRIEPWTTATALREQESEAFRTQDDELTQRLDAARAAVPERGLIDRFQEELRQDAERRRAAVPDVAAVLASYEALVAEPTIEARDRLLGELQRFVAAAKLRQENAERRLRFRRADLDEARSSYEAAIGEGSPKAKTDTLKLKTERVKREVVALAAAVETTAAHHQALTQSVEEITREEQTARQLLAEHRAARDQLDRTLAQQAPNFGKRLLRLPLVDAFGRPLAIEQLWLPDLTINYNFRQVARFDRCTTCHLGIDKTLPGSPAEPAYLPEEVVKLQLAAPARAPQAERAPPGGREELTLERTCGFSLAPSGMLDPQEVTVGLVLPKTAAARAGLAAGDVILAGHGTPVTGAKELTQLLLDNAGSGSPVELEIRRGLPHPYRSHPRLDLFVGSLSPHPMADFGCTICHDGQGSATEFKFASHSPNDLPQRARWRRGHGWFRNPDWDFPMRPQRFAESNCLKCHHDVSDLEPSRRFPDPPAAKLLAGYHLIRQNGCFGCHEIKGIGGAGERIGPDMRLEPGGTAGLSSSAAPVNTARQVGSATRAVPGTMRKVGPSLRDVKAKLDAAMLETWIAEPAGFRPDTRMPRFFGMHEHLDEKGLEDARRFEPVEIRAVTEYLLAASQAVSPLPAPPEVTEAPSMERGKRLFRIHGCLACHRHSDFPEAQATQGPDLSRVGAKLNAPAGTAWLASWLRDPVRHSQQTVMPNSLLVPEPLPAASGREPANAPAGKTAKPRMTDPAADIAAYLAGSTAGWKPKPPAPLVDTDLDALARLHLSKTFPAQTADKYLREGIPASMAKQVPPDAVELVGPIDRRKKLLYVGRRTIGKRGCFGCHDIPGFEDAQPIGPALSDWGRKQESLLAFEQVHRFLEQPQPSPKERGGSEMASPPGQSADAESDTDRQFFLDAIRSKRREGFLWQKLRAPRSFDYKKTANKDFNEHLLMGRFSFTPAEREAIITFVLGLVAEPPAEKHLPQPDARRKAVIEGRKVLDKYACAQCHTLEMERWTIDYDPAKFPSPPVVVDLPFVKPQATPAQLVASQKTDRRGLCRVELVGMPRWNAEGKPEETEDEDGNPQYAFDLWEPAVIAGKVWPVGGASVLVSPGQIVRKRWPLGGDFARLLYPAAAAEAKAAGSTAGTLEAWGWVPPPLVHTGRKVQPAWLHDYLLEPSVIRPAAVLRMPKYNLSPAEAARLVDYFAATAGTDFPFDSDPRGRGARLATAQTEQPQPSDNAFRVITDRKTFCAKCHLVGDYGPGGETRTVLAPNLERVGRRIRPEYLHRWIANPKSVLPYTAMPVNFPVDQSLGQDLLPGSSPQQLDAVVGLLLDYDGYMKRRTPIRKLIESGGK